MTHITAKVDLKFNDEDCGNLEDLKETIHLALQSFVFDKELMKSDLGDKPISTSLEIDGYIVNNPEDWK
jgi:hypothetical protein